MKKILSENAIHDLAAPKFHYCLTEQNAPIFLLQIQQLC